MLYIVGQFFIALFEYPLQALGMLIICSFKVYACMFL